MTRFYDLFFRGNSSPKNKETVFDLKMPNTTFLQKCLKQWYTVGLLFILVQANAFAQTGTGVTINGIVKDTKGQALPGVSVAIKGSSTVTLTANTGNYTIKVPSSSSTLVFSFIGFNKQEINIDGKNVIDVVMTEEDKRLDEVVIVGYGSQKKIANTGSIASVKSEDLVKTPVVNIAQGLQSRVSGLQVTQNNAAPGGNISVRVRGTNSINGSSEPLYVIDGIQISNESGANTPSPLSTINPSDVESVEILKDASATAIYGARGANGVVLITTKRGKLGVTSIQAESYVGVQKITKIIPVLNATQFAQLENEVYKTTIYANPENEGEGTNWQDEIYRSAKIQNYMVSAAGGSDKTKFSVSANYFDQDGIVIGSNFKRYSLRATLDHSINERFKFGATILSSYTINQGISTSSQSLDGAATTGSVVGAALGAPPTLKPYRADGSIFPLSDQFNGRYREVTNPLGLTEIFNQQQTKRTLANVYVETKIVEGLTYRAAFNADLASTLSDGYSPIYILGALERNATSGSAYKGNSNANALLHESILTYMKSFGQHSLKFTGVYATQVNLFNRNEINANGFPNDVTKNEAVQLAINRSVTGFRSREALESFMGRINYNFADKYFFDVTARYDGNSKFGQNKKWGFFPAISGAWRIIKEDFMQNSNLFSDLKLRASYGITGNAAAIDPYKSLATLTSGSDYEFEHTYTVGISPSGIPNADLRWEKSTQANIGLDFSFLKGRLNFVIDAYNKKTKDILFVKALPFSSGYPSITGNFASIVNKGLEFAVNTKILDGELKWDLNANFSINRNKLLSLEGDVKEFVLSPYAVLSVGQPLGVFKTYVYNGIYQTGENILPGSDGRVGGPKVADLNGDGLITAADQKITGNANPNYIFGLSTNLSYKNFDFSMFVSGVQGNQIYNLSRYTFENPLGGRNAVAGVANRWSPTNPTNDFATGIQGGRLPVSDRFVEDGSFIRLKNISLGYSLKNIKALKNVRIYISANNLVTITNYSGYDPEVNTFGGSNTLIGVDNLVYPVAKTYLIGLQIGL
jgi:TonB-linked SusC/RagA family outer membrane protein